MSKFKKIILVLVLITLGNQCILFAQENPEDIAIVNDEIEDNFYEALKQRAIENYDKAIISIEKCILKVKDNPVFYHELGKNLLHLKKYPEAEKPFKKQLN
ncbi:MAG: hypothetical protein HC854_12130 [Flavobacterium sp.]|nr:hypothetical protein [Flavobacterium sp.]